MAKFYEPKKIAHIGTSFLQHPLHALGNANKTAFSTLTGGLIQPRQISKNRLLNFGLTGSINKQGNPLSRGDVPPPPKALPPTAQLPNVPFSSGGAGRRRGRRGNGTILTGPRGLNSQSAGKSMLGG